MDRGLTAFAVTALKWLLATAAIFYVGAIAALLYAERSILYPIPQTVRTPPAAAGYAEAEEHSLDTRDGEKLVAWHVPPDEGKPVVIFLHGNGEVLAWRVPRFRELTRYGTGLIAVSFRGYAGSSGSPTEAGLFNDAQAAYAFAAARYPADRIIVWGYSLGTGPAVALAASQKIGGLILEAPYTSTADVAASLIPLIPVRWLMRDQFRSDERIGNVTAPILVMLGDQDRVIPPRFSERLFALAPEPKQLVRFAGGGHENLDAFGIMETVREFLALPGAIPENSRG